MEYGKHFEYVNGANPDTILPLNLTYQAFDMGNDLYNTAKPFNGHLTTTNLRINQTSRGPFDLPLPQFRTFVQSLQSLSITFFIRNFDVKSSSRICYRWNVMTTYSFSSRGFLSMKVVPREELCAEEVASTSAIMIKEQDWYSSHRLEPWYNRTAVGEISLAILILVSATVSQILDLKAIFRSVQMYRVGATIVVCLCCDV